MLLFVSLLLCIFWYILIENQQKNKENYINDKTRQISIKEFSANYRIVINKM